MEVCLTNIKQIIEVGRSLRMEIISTTIERLTSDDRDTNLDQKLSKIFILKNSYGRKVIDDVAPKEDNIVLRKHVLQFLIQQIFIIY